MSPAHSARRIGVPPAWAAVTAVLFALGCGGGGGDSSSDPTPCTAMSFDRALTTPAAGDVYLDQADAGCSTLDVAVVIANLSGIWTVGFDIDYPDTLLEFTSATLGPLMLKDSPMNRPTVVFKETPGMIQIGVSRFGSDPSINAVGSEALLFLRFRRVAAGAGNIDFDTSGGGEEIVQDDLGAIRPASFGPGHGGAVTVP